MDRDAAEKRILQLSEELHKHNHLYYVMAQPIIRDYEFDQLLKELEDLEATWPDLALPNSPTRRVGGEITKEFPAFFHVRPMLSLQNTYSREEVEDFDTQVTKILEGRSYSYILQQKFDGVSLSLHYANGVLTAATTRGDGVRGDEITANARTIRSVPITIPADQVPTEFEVRGEVLMHNDDFQRLNEQREKDGEAALMNPRNATAGTLKMQDSAVVASRPLRFYAYYLESDSPLPDSDLERMELLKKWGFLVDENIGGGKTIDELFHYIDDMAERRGSLNYEIDGVVIKVNEVAMRDFMGTTSKFPRWAIAYKYQAEQAETTLRFVNFQVGRTGKITPVSNLEPVLLAGTTVKRASLYNKDELVRLDLHEGDRVIVAKGGEIIPKIIAVRPEFRKEDSKPVEFLAECPECGTPLVQPEGSVDFFCPNDTGCPPQVKGRIEHFVARRAMRIEGLGEEIINQLFQEGLIRNVADLYDLKYEQLIGLERFAEKSASNLIESIEKSKEVPFARVLFALGIRHVGETVAKKLARQFPSLDALRSADQETLSDIQDIGPRIAESLVEFFGKEENMAMIERLRDAGVQLEADEEEAGADSQKLGGKSFVVSGSFEHFSRDGIKDHINANGGQVKSSLSSKVDYLLTGSDAGPSKLKKAEKLGIQVITEEAYREMTS